MTDPLKALLGKTDGAVKVMQMRALQALKNKMTA